ncbi:MAG: hypothetical protein EON59_06150 [Alphaproteobacteria bacterium]|nr:MAG: hypothetical protein EON59_06150 [Alphaproteobacteria bacterium]
MTNDCKRAPYYLRRALSGPAIAAGMLIGICGCKPAEARPEPGYDGLDAASAKRSLAAGDQRLCNDAGVKNTVRRLIEDTEWAYEYASEERELFLRSVEITIDRVTLQARDPSIPWMDCEARTTASEGSGSWEWQQTYRLSELVDENDIQVEIIDPNVGRSALVRLATTFKSDVIWPARRVAADNDAAPICAAFRSGRARRDDAGLVELRNALAEILRRHKADGAGPLLRQCRADIDAAASASNLARQDAELQAVPRKEEPPSAPPVIIPGPPPAPRETTRTWEEPVIIPGPPPYYR